MHPHNIALSLTCLILRSLSLPLDQKSLQCSKRHRATHSAEMALLGLGWSLEKSAAQSELRGRIVQSYNPELIQTMRAALEEVMTKIPAEQATPGVKAALAECILKAAANGQTNYDGLITAASKQIQTIVSMLT
jgi:hypothetical protein